MASRRSWLKPSKSGIVAEAAADLGRSEPGLERLLARRVAQELRQRLLAGLPGLNGRPIGNQPAQNRWTAARHDLRLEPLAVDVADIR